MGGKRAARKDETPRPEPGSAEHAAAPWFSGQDLVDAASALRRLQEPGKPPPTRLWNACLKLSRGHVRELYHYVRQAELDFRDVLYWAESYEEPGP